MSKCNSCGMRECCGADMQEEIATLRATLREREAELESQKAGHRMTMEMLDKAEKRAEEAEARFDDLRLMAINSKKGLELTESRLAASETSRRRMAEALKDLIFTAGKLWDEVKPIKDTHAMTVTHPIIEEAKAALTEGTEERWNKTQRNLGWTPPPSDGKGENHGK